MVPVLQPKEWPAFEQLLAELIETLGDTVALQLEAKLNTALRRLLSYFEFQHASFLEVTAGSHLNVVCAVSVEADDRRPLVSLPDQSQWCLNTLQSGGAITIRRLPDDLEPVLGRLYVRRTGIRAHVLVPVISSGKVCYAIWFAAVDCRDPAATGFFAQLKVVAQVLAQAVTGIRAQNALATVGQKLGQPLAAILGQAHAALRLLEQGKTGDRELRKAIEVIAQEGQRVCAAIGGLAPMTEREGYSKVIGVPVPKAKPPAPAEIWIVDSDHRFTETLRQWLLLEGLSVTTFASLQALVDYPGGRMAACLLIGVCWPQLPAIALLRLLRSQGIHAPVVFIAEACAVSDGIEAIKQGAQDYLIKPVGEEVLRRVVFQALERYAADEKHERILRNILARVSKLSLREREVMDGVVRGLLNKQIAARLGITEATVKQHRGRVMAKMQASSVAELVHLNEVVSHG